MRESVGEFMDKPKEELERVKSAINIEIDALRAEAARPGFLKGLRWTRAN